MGITMNTEDFLKILHQDMKELREDVSFVKAEMTTLKVKVAVFSSFIGGAFSFIVQKFF
jgi:hypothetical protein